MNRLTLFVAVCVTLVAVACGAAGATGRTAFSQDSAYADLRTLAGTIGPRPMGSPAERSALAFAVDRFRAYGCQEAYVM
ncbi:MAG TPA: hypothetical protein VMM80_12305, partial [Bacteroidota bacterium]|nr:hypothetical protein [Bacteroidota bacterium]